MSSDAITAAVRETVEAVLKERDEAIQKHELIAAVLRKPLLFVPDDLQVVFSIGRSAAFDLADGAGFPPTSKIGRKRFVETAALMEWVRGKVAC